MSRAPSAALRFCNLHPRRNEPSGSCDPPPQRYNFARACLSPAPREFLCENFLRCSCCFAWPLPLSLAADTVVEEIVARVNNQIITRTEYLHSKDDS